MVSDPLSIVSRRVLGETPLGSFGLSKHAPVMSDALFIVSQIAQGETQLGRFGIARNAPVVSHPLCIVSHREVSAMFIVP